MTVDIVVGGFTISQVYKERLEREYECPTTTGILDLGLNSTISIAFLSYVSLCARRVVCVLLDVQIHCMLIGECDAMLCPIRVVYRSAPGGLP